MAGRPCHASAQAPGACAAAGKAVTAGKEDVTFMLEYSLSPAQPSSVMQRSHAPSPLVLRLGMLALAASVASCGGGGGGDSNAGGGNGGKWGGGGPRQPRGNPGTPPLDRERAPLKPPPPLNSCARLFL